MKYDLESDIEALEGAGYTILSYTKTRNGHAILWFDDRGCSITTRKPKSSSVSGILSFEAARTEYLRVIYELL